MTNLTIYFNPNCSKCNLTKALLEKSNIQPIVSEYLDTPPTKGELTYIISLGIPTKDLIRTGEDAWSQTGLDIETASDDDLINAIIAHPVLLQRPIVIANGKAVIARPPEKVLEVL